MTLERAIYNISPSALVPNSKLCLIHYRSAFPTDKVTTETVSSHFKKNLWEEKWQYGMYYKSHYHSTTHEALGIIRGQAKLKFGISDAESPTETSKPVELKVQKGDVLVIPAGVAHRCLEEEGEFLMVGAYPVGAKEWDMNYGSEDEVKRKLGVPIPEKDPVLGDSEEGLVGLWKQK